VSNVGAIQGQEDVAQLLMNNADTSEVTMSDLPLILRFYAFGGGTLSLVALICLLLNEFLSDCLQLAFASG
jgi:hypothetical protein